MVKTTINVDVDARTKKMLEQRAKKELMTLEELASDILRRSTLSYKGGSTYDKVDDKFITFFSRKQQKKKKTNKNLKEKSYYDSPIKFS